MEPTLPAPKILVVDDNPDNRALAQATLEDEGYEVVTAESGEEALRVFVAEHPDCVLLDVRMPGMDGFATCARLRELPGGLETPIIFLTAQRDLETFDRAQRSGSDDYLTKPFRPAELFARVQSALKLRRMSAELREHYDLVRHQRDALMRLQLQKERLTAFVIHDLKNPVNAMDLHAQLLLRDRTLQDSSRNSVMRIREEARSLLRLLLNLLDISKSEEGQLAPHRETVDLHALTSEVLDALHPRAEAASVRMVRAIDTASVQADADLLRRVLENFVENAIRHAPENSQVLLSTRLVDGQVELRVADTGRGVPEDMHERVFERFVQLDNGERVVTRTGRGLGLSFCKLAIEAHGGTIWVEDGQPGAVFCVKMPA